MSKKQMTDLVRLMKNAKPLMHQLLVRKTMESPLVGHEPVSLSALMDRVLWAIDRPGSYYPGYLDEILKDVNATENILANILMVMNWKRPDAKKPLLYELASKRKKKK